MGGVYSQSVRRRLLDDRRDGSVVVVTRVAPPTGSCLIATVCRSRSVQLCRYESCMSAVYPVRAWDGKAWGRRCIGGRDLAGSLAERDLPFGELSDPYLLEAVPEADSAAFPALPAIPVRRTAHTLIDYDCTARRASNHHSRPVPSMLRIVAEGLRGKHSALFGIGQLRTELTQVASPASSCE